MPFDAAPSPPPAETPALPLSPEQRVLLKAAEVVDRGWCQGAAVKWKDGTGRMRHSITVAGGMYRRDKPIEACTLGALMIASHLEGFHEDEYIRAVDLLQAHIGLAAVDYWNDRPNRTATEVASALRAAARRAGDA